jgi:hypothetical protein
VACVPRAGWKKLRARQQDWFSEWSSGNYVRAVLRKQRLLQGWEAMYAQVDYFTRLQSKAVRGTPLTATEAGALHGALTRQSALTQWLYSMRMAAALGLLSVERLAALRALSCSVSSPLDLPDCLPACPTKSTSSCFCYGTIGNPPTFKRSCAQASTKAAPSAEPPHLLLACRAVSLVVAAMPLLSSHVQSSSPGLLCP